MNSWMAMTLHALTEDLALKDIERREQGGDARRPLIIVGHAPARPFFIGSPGWVRSSA